MSDEKIKNRFELIFLYDVRDANPNGDPDNANLPRMDDETGENIVTDLRLKRTIRDYWASNNKDILVRAEDDEKGNRKSMANLVLDFLGLKKADKKNAGEIKTKILEGVPKKYIDIRAFGAAITLENANVSITGAVQFGLGRSLNKPNIHSITITTTLASGEQKGMGTIGEYHVVDYSLIRFHGIISEINARKSLFSENDLKDLLDAMWNGTKQLNTRSKFNHIPRLLIAIKMKEGMTQIGDLDLEFSLSNAQPIKSIEDVALNASEFLKKITPYKSIIEIIRIKKHSDLTIVDNKG
ncbi:MAG: type I-B CRISPR-associated protein Cas7/Csh2, partial [Promethearchaeota archaeon]